jgi:ABC-type tungstate transport system substrate-binding protein
MFVVCALIVVTAVLMVPVMIAFVVAHIRHMVTD